MHPIPARDRPFADPSHEELGIAWRQAVPVERLARVRADVERMVRPREDQDRIVAVPRPAERPGYVGD